MSRAELLRTLEIAQKFIHDPSEHVIFTSRSLSDILSNLRREVEDAPDDVGSMDILEVWERRSENFRRTLIASATRDNSTVMLDGRMAAVIREHDAADGATRCRKGPDYPYHSTSVTSTVGAARRTRRARSR